MPSPTSSPARPPVASSAVLDFGDAMRDVLRGLRVTRKEWQSKDVVFLQGGVLHIQIDEDNEEKGLKAGVHRFVVSEGDIAGEDWVVVPRT